MKQYSIIFFYTILATLIVINSWLLSGPNLVGKIGLTLYKYYYLRTFPRTLLTVSIISFIAIGVGFLLSVLVRKQIIKKVLAYGILWTLLFFCVAILAKIAVDFSRWTYGHTGLRFRLGVYMLPLLPALITGHTIWRLGKSGDRQVAHQVEGINEKETREHHDQ